MALSFSDLLLLVVLSFSAIILLMVLRNFRFLATQQAQNMAHVTAKALEQLYALRLATFTHETDELRARIDALERQALTVAAHMQACEDELHRLRGLLRAEG